MTTPPPAWSAPPQLSPGSRIRAAYAQRAETDYVFTGAGLNIFLTIITCGIFGFFLFYQLMKRDRDHNRRRLELLDAANTAAWAQANTRGLADELRPAFERVALSLTTLRRMTTDFRDPVVWLVIDLVTGLSNLALSGIAQIVGFVLIDTDLATHDRAELSAETELAGIYTRLGMTLPVPDPSRVKGRHNYAGRVVASILTCGIYTFFWLYDLQVEGNAHVEANWPFEDALVATLPA